MGLARTIQRHVIFRHPLIALVVLLAGVRAAEGCDCARPQGQDIIRGAAAVFRATVVKLDYLEKDAPGTEPRILVTFEVHEVWKGPTRSTALLRTTYNKWTCRGYYFKAGGEYLVALEKIEKEGSETKPSELSGVHLCGGTVPVDRAADDLAALGAGRRVRKP